MVSVVVIDDGIWTDETEVMSKVTARYVCARQKFVRKIPMGESARISYRTSVQRYVLSVFGS